MEGRDISLNLHLKFTCSFQCDITVGRFLRGVGDPAAVIPSALGHEGRYAREADGRIVSLYFSEIISLHPQAPAAFRCLQVVRLESDFEGPYELAKPLLLLQVIMLFSDSNNRLLSLPP